MSTPEHWRTSRQFADWFTNRSVAFVRVLGWLMIAFSVYLFVLAADYEHRGRIPGPLRYGSTRYSRIDRNEFPVLFRKRMSYEWARPVVIFLGGCALLGIVRWADRSDPFSKSFAGKKALEDCERVLDNELENFHRPLRN